MSASQSENEIVSFPVAKVDNLEDLASLHQRQIISSFCCDVCEKLVLECYNDSHCVVHVDTILCHACGFARCFPNCPNGNPGSNPQHNTSSPCKLEPVKLKEGEASALMKLANFDDDADEWYSEIAGFIQDQEIEQKVLNLCNESQ
jgi:hypothetical protein